MARNYRIPVLVSRKEKLEYERLAQGQKKSLGQLVRELLEAEQSRLSSENPKEAA